MLLLVLFYGACNWNIKYALHGNHDILVSFQLERGEIMEVEVTINQIELNLYVVKKALQQNFKMRNDV